jgi:hypothetical protein
VLGEVLGELDGVFVEGVFVGERVGNADGGLVIAAPKPKLVGVRDKDGGTEAVRVGAALGGGLGRSIGDSVGEALVCSVGDTDGADVGAPVEGALDGLLLG